MSKCLRGNSRFWLLALAVLLLAGCKQQTIPTVVPLPTPDAHAIYMMLTMKYTSDDVILRIYDMSPDEVARILQALQSIEPPDGLEALHEQALDAYRIICKGKLLLPGADPVLRSEAYFAIDWGIGLLRDYRERLDKQ
nr:hypothetical protein [Chloroflexota bacterium]